MTKAFKKGDEATLIASWDRKGTVCTRQVIVHSCGKKQMVLIDAESGKEIGRHFKPHRAGPGEFGVRPRITGDELREEALACAAAEREREEAHFARCLAGGHGEDYDAAIRKEMAELHDFEVIDRTGK